MPIRYCDSVLRSTIRRGGGHSTMPIRYCDSVIRSSIRIGGGFRLILALDRSSAMKIDRLVHRFGGSAISNSSTIKSANATLMTYMPSEQEALYQEVVKRLCKEICRFPLAKGRVWLFPRETTVGLRFKLPDQVQTILREMSTALPSVEGIKICEELMVPVWQVPYTGETFSAARRKVWQFRNRMIAAYPDGVRLRGARGLILQNGADSETTPKPRFFINHARWQNRPTPEKPKDPHGTIFRQLSLTPEIRSRETYLQVA